MRVLAIHRYYWPDSPPYASLLRAITATWTDHGHQVDVLTSQPSYKPELANARRPAVEHLDRTTVRRIAMKPDRSGRGRQLTNMVRFPLLVAWHVLRGPRYDVVMCSTAPPVLLGAAVSWAARRRGARFVYHCMDLHPEIGVLSGQFSNPIVRKVLTLLDRGACRRAAVVVVLSGDMRASLLRRDPGLAGRIVVLNNFELPDFDAAESTSPLAPDPDRLRIVFTGNIGRFQGLESVVRAVVEDDGLAHVQLVLMGEGGAKQELRELIRAATEDRRERVVLLPHGTPGEARALAGTADLGLVSLVPGVIDYAYPSKTATYLSASLPVLVVVEQSSELARMVVENAIGAVLPRDTEGMRQVLHELGSDRQRLAGMRVRAGEVWAKELAAEELLPRWTELLERLAVA